MGKLLAALVTLPTLAGCDQLIDDCIEWTFYPNHGIEVANQGNSEARVTVTFEEWVEEGEDSLQDSRYVTRTRIFDVNPGDQEERWYGDVEMTVTVTRKSDGLLLYQDHYSDRDFEKEHDRVELTVYP